MESDDGASPTTTSTLSSHRRHLSTDYSREIEFELEKYTQADIQICMQSTWVEVQGR